MREGQPLLMQCVFKGCEFSPHVRGSTRDASLEARRKLILPACAGVNLSKGPIICHLRDSPRMCGGQPHIRSLCDNTEAFSPHVRGSTCRTGAVCQGARILPACAGVNLKCVRKANPTKNSPRMCGGQPCAAPSLACHSRFTPHARGLTKE